MIGNMYKKKKICFFIIILLIAVNREICGMYNNVEAEKKLLSATVTVLVNLNGGHVNGNTEYALIGKPGESVILTSPTYEGYEFAGYNCSNGTVTVDRDCNMVYTFGNTNTIITAIWKQQSKNLLLSETPEVATQEAIEIVEISEVTTQQAIITETPKIEETKENELLEVVEELQETNIPKATEDLENQEITKELEETAPSEETKSPKVIAAKSINAKAVKINIGKNIYYTSYKSKVEPNVKINYNGKNLIEDKDYTVTFRKNSSYGKAEVIMKGIGSYTGTVTKKFYILPEKTKIRKCRITLKNKGRIIKIVWKKLKGADGYQIVYSKKKKGVFKEISKKSAKETSAAFWFLGEEVYMKVRPYVIIDGKYKYGKYSNVKAIKNKL